MAIRWQCMSSCQPAEVLPAGASMMAGPQKTCDSYDGWETSISGHQHVLPGPTCNLKHLIRKPAIHFLATCTHTPLAFHTAYCLLLRLILLLPPRGRNLQTTLLSFDDNQPTIICAHTPRPCWSGWNNSVCLKKNALSLKAITLCHNLCTP